jgi:hypothetical protein
MMIMTGVSSFSGSAGCSGLLASVVSAKSLFVWDSPDAINSGHAIWLEIFVAVAAVALLMQAVAVIAVALAGYKAQKRAMQIIEEVRERSVPLMLKSQLLIEKSHELIGELTPKIQTITANIEQISTVIKDKVVEIEPTVSAANATAQDANAKAHQQIIRVNGMITSALNATAEISDTIYQGIRTPAREIAGVISGVKAGLDSLLSKAKGFGAGIRPAASGPIRTSAASTSSLQVKAAARAFQRAEQSDLDL